MPLRGYRLTACDEAVRRQCGRSTSYGTKPSLRFPTARCQQDSAANTFHLLTGAELLNEQQALEVNAAS